MDNFAACSRLPDSSIMLQIISALTEISKIGPDMGMLMSAVTDISAKFTKADGATVELADGEEMVYRAVSGSLSPHLGLRLKRNSSLSGLCVAEGIIMNSTDTSNDPRVDAAACLRVNAKSMLVVPLKHNEQCVGVLKVVSSALNAFGSDEICILSLIADNLGAALYHASKYAEDELLKKSTTDAMTGLANRASFYDRLRILTGKAAKSGKSYAVMIIDMDGLKFINDTYGHQAGDAAITEFARRLKDTSRQSDIVARLGGDEFGIIVVEISEADTALSLSERIHSSVSQPFFHGTIRLPLSGSTGFAVFPDDSEDINDLVNLADRAMYDMKKLRKSARGENPSSSR